MTMPKMATATPSGQAHGFRVQAPYANATSNPAYASAARPSSPPSAPKRIVPPNRTMNPPNSPRTPPIAAGTVRSVIPVGRAPAAVAAGGDQVVEAGAGADEVGVVVVVVVVDGVGAGS